MRITNFPGLNLQDDPMEVGLDGLVAAENIDISKKNKPSRRVGRSLFYAGSPAAGWSDGRTCLFVEGATLKQLNTDGTATSVATLTVTSRALRAVRAYDDRLYWTTGADSGVIDRGANRQVGVLKPGSLVLESTEVGALPAGGYMVGLAYVDARGAEGPMSYSAAQLAGGVSVRIPHTPLELVAAGVEAVRLYLSTPDGEVPYLADEVATGESSYISYAGDATDLGVPGEADNLDNLPLGGFLEEFAARLWSSLGGQDGTGLVVYTHPYSELTNLHGNFFAFPSEVAGLGGVDTGRFAGLYVGTAEAVYFLQGTDPQQMSSKKVMDYGMIPGTLTKTDGRVLGEGTDTPVLLWASPRGICAGYPDGQAVNLTQRRIGSLTGHAGTAILRRANGQNHLLTVLRS